MPYFDGRRGRVFHDSWLPAAETRGAVVLLHGYGEHLGLYDALGRRLVRDGFAVHALDSVGHGRSDGPRAVIETWDDFVADAMQLVDLVNAQHDRAPLAVIGHSGGAVAAALLALRFPETAQAVVLSGATIAPLAWVDEFLASAAAETEGGEPPEFLSTHPEYVHALLHDPLTWKGGFRRETMLALRATWPELAAGFAQGRPDVPVLFVHGTADPIAPLADVERVAGPLARARLRTFAGDLHDVLNEHDRDAVHDVVADFLAASLKVRAPA